VAPPDVIGLCPQKFYPSPGGRCRECGEELVEYVRPDRHVEALREALRECARLSGADLSGGFPTWPELPTFAVQSVAELREDYSDAGEASMQAAFWRARAVELGASETEYRERYDPSD
jgi:hypothetical protein